MPVIEEWCGSYPLPEDKPRGVLHCFNSDIATAEWYLERGFYISIGAYVGYPSSSQLRETLKSLPMDRLVVETDCPFLPPQNSVVRGMSLAYTVTTVEVLAITLAGNHRGNSREDHRENAIKLFGDKGEGIINHGEDGSGCDYENGCLPDREEEPVSSLVHWDTAAALPLQS
jgi:Tat protein secretion system quality control protein TatD with DNase activity